MTTKRALGDMPAPSPFAPHKHQEEDGAPLQRITRVLESVTRVADTWTCGSDSRFPLPALAFKSHKADDHTSEPELSLPLRPDDMKLVKVRGVASQRYGGADVAWDVRGDLIESRNPSWHEFLDEQLVRIRRRFGVFKHEQVKLSLRKMVLAETDAVLHGKPEDDASIRPSGAFGTFVVVLPGSFEGGEVEILQEKQDNGASEDQDEGDLNDEDDYDDEDSDSFWWPDDREHDYCLSFAAFYDHCQCDPYPLISGSALCLVYDLVTSPRDVDFLRGPEVVQRCVDAELSSYFQVMSEPMAKQLRISADAWQTVTEFAMDRNFVYILKGKEYEDRNKKFEDLRYDDQLVAESLATFCARSNGAYVLFLAHVHCSRFDTASSNPESWERVEKTGTTSMSVALRAPWITFGESRSMPFPPLYVNHHQEVAPFGRLASLPLRRYGHLNDDVDIDIAEELYGSRGVLRCVLHTTYALVVQPALVEASQLTKLPIPEALEILRLKLSNSREDALRYAQRVISYRPEWSADPDPSEGFPSFVNLLVDLNSLPLFTDFLLTLGLCSVDETGTLREAVRHFGWDACEEILIKRLLSAPKLHSRVNLLVSVIDACEGPDRVNKLLDNLLSLHPWTDAKVAPRTHIRVRRRYTSAGSDFRQLLDVINQWCPQRFTPVVSVKDHRKLVKVIVPAMTSFVEANPTDAQAWHALLHVRSLLKAKAPEIFNDAWTQVRIEHQCGVCSEIQAFLSSTATETVVQCTQPKQIKHVKTVLKKHLGGVTELVIDPIGSTAVRLTKLPPDDMLHYHLTEHEKQMRRLLARSDRPQLPDITLEATSSL